jgi:pentatricopeptide repeat protein
MRRSARMWTLGLFIILLTPLSARGQVQSTPNASEAIQRAQEYYDQSSFEAAIELLQDALTKGSAKAAETQAARELLARCYVKSGKSDKAREVFKGLLKDESNYAPDPVRVPPDELAVFEEARNEFKNEALRQSTQMAGGEAGPAESKPIYKRWYLWAGVAAAGVLVYLLLKDPPPDEETVLPDFPNPPAAPSAATHRDVRRESVGSAR